MVEVSDDTTEQLEEFAEKNELDFSEVMEQFEQNYEDVQEKATNVGEDYLETLALRTTRTQELAKFRNVEGVEMATIGGSVREWGDGGNARDVFVGKALVDVEPNEPGRDFLSTVIFDSDDGVNMGQVNEAFSEVGNIVTGEFSVSEGFTDTFRVLNSDEDTEINVIEPDDRTEVLNDIRDMVTETDIAHITENMSAEERDDESGDMYPANFGVDIRRITVDIYDGYKNPARGFGMYTVRDDTVFDEEDIVASPVFDSEDANENATPGMTCFMDSVDMEFGSGSVVEFFGPITKSDDGIVQMNVDGIVPIMADGEFDGYTDESDPEAPEQQSSSNVDREAI